MCLPLMSKIPIMEKKYDFTKTPLSKIHRFFITLKMMKAIMGTKYTTPIILYIIMSDLYEEENDIGLSLEKAIMGFDYKKNNVEEIKEHFLRIYNNDTLIEDYMNKKINNQYISMMKANINKIKNSNKSSKKKVDETISTIILESGIADFIMNY